MKMGMQVPRIGGKGEAPFDVSQARKLACGCGCDLFDKAVRVGYISKMAPGNRTGQDINVEGVVYVCRGCGVVVGDQVVKGDQSTGGGSDLPNP